MLITVLQHIANMWTAVKLLSVFFIIAVFNVSLWR